MIKISTLLFAAFLASQSLQGQVGINTVSPQATLDIRAKNHLGSVSPNDGLLIPSVTSLGISGTVNGQLVFLASDSGTLTKGFYYWNGTAWTSVASNSSNTNIWQSDSSNLLIKLATKSDGTARTSGTEFVVKDNGSLSIGKSGADASSILDVSSSNKGVLLPQVTLSGITDTSTIISPATGLIVYNTGNGTLKAKGYLYWNGSEWKNLNNSSAANPSISSLSCTSATTNPLTFTSGTPYTGTMTIPYTGGNGGSYNAGTAFTSNGLTFTLQPGSLAYGPGSLIYNITGTPTFSSPSTVTIPVTFEGNTCSTSIGSNLVIKPIEYASNSVSPINASTPTNSVTTIGNISLRFNGTSSGSGGNLIDIRLNGVTDHITIWKELAGSGGTNYDAWQRINNVAANTWQNVTSSATINNSDNMRLMISLLSRREVYRATIQMNGDDTGITPKLTSAVKIYIEKID